MPILKNIAMVTLERCLLKSKFRGCLLGSLIGDCLGAPYEGDTVTHGEKIIIQRYFDKLEDPNHKGPYKSYTDDTAMMKSMAKFLIDKPEPDYKFLAKLFVNEYFKDRRRGYGENVIEVFHKLKNSKFKDIFKPASEQFLGSGSYGNGGAMRIAPVALYFHDNYETMLEVATNTTKLTHTNALGVNGALLQSIAVQQTLQCDPKNIIDPKLFCRELCQKMKKIEIMNEDEVDDNVDGIGTAYQQKLNIVEHLIGKKTDADLDEEVISSLGNGISAFESVPTAIYCFLRAQNEIPHVKTNNVFRRTIQYAIGLGGDTDTIACMAGALAGAFLGEEAINPSFIKNCELSKEIIEMADNLWDTKETQAVSFKNQ